MIEKIKITVIVPAYNVEEWFPRCIESILNQNHKALEIIVINDGSTDGTGQLVDEYAKKDNRIVAVHQENKGLIEVRERGIRMATGQYITFVDGDDEIEPDMFERLLNNALKYEAEISQCGILYCFYDGRKKQMHGTGKVYVFDKIEGYRELMQGIHMEPSLCNKLYKKELLQDSCPDKSIVNNEDLLRNSVLFSRANKSVFEDFCGYHYWRRAESMSNNTRAVQNGNNILKARKLIMDSASSAVWSYAFSCYVSALISTYNSLIGNDSAEADQLRNHCRKELRNRKTHFMLLGRGMRFRSYGILYFSVFYNLFYKAHIKILHAKIRQQAKSCK